MEIWAKFVKTFAKSLKIWEKMASNLVWFEKNGAQCWQNNMKT